MKLTKLVSAGFQGLALLGLFVDGAYCAPDLPVPSNQLFIGQMLQVLLALAVTIAVIWGASKLVIKQRWNRGHGSQKLQIIDSIAIGTRDRIMLIEVENQQIVVASTPGQISALHSFEKSSNGSFQATLSSAQSDVACTEHSR